MRRSTQPCQLKDSYLSRACRLQPTSSRAGGLQDHTYTALQRYKQTDETNYSSKPGIYREQTSYTKTYTLAINQRDLDQT